MIPLRPHQFLRVLQQCIPITVHTSFAPAADEKWKYFIIFGRQGIWNGRLRVWLWQGRYIELAWINYGYVKILWKECFGVYCKGGTI